MDGGNGGNERAHSISRFRRPSAASTTVCCVPRCSLRPRRAMGVWWRGGCADEARFANMQRGTPRTAPRVRRSSAKSCSMCPRGGSSSPLASPPPSPPYPPSHAPQQRVAPPRASILARSVEVRRGAREACARGGDARARASAPHQPARLGKRPRQTESCARLAGRPPCASGAQQRTARRDGVSSSGCVETPPRHAGRGRRAAGAGGGRRKAGRPRRARALAHLVL